MDEIPTRTNKAIHNQKKKQIPTKSINMATRTPKPKPTVPIALSAESIDDLIYDARAGDLEALTTDIASLTAQHNCAEALIVASAIDMEEESEGGSGSCVLHFPAANGNIGRISSLLFFSFSVALPFLFAYAIHFKSA